MTQIECDECKSIIDVPDGYTAPYIQCPACGSHKKLQIAAPNGPKYKILDDKGRERAANKTVSEEVILPEDQPQQIHKPIKQIQHKKPVLPKIDSPIVDTKQLIIDSIGEEGLKKTFELASNYALSGEKGRKAGRSKAMQQLMKEKYTGELAAKALEFSEKQPEVLEAAKQKKTKKFILFGIVAVIIVIILCVAL